MSALNEALKIDEIRAAANDHASASRHLDAFCQTVAAARSRRLAYENLETSDTERAATQTDVAARVRAMFDAQKSALKVAFSTVAESMRDGNGDPLTLQDILDEIAGAA